MILSNVSHAMTLLIITLCFSPVADVSGKWIGGADTGREIQLNLKAEGKKLTGTVVVGGGKEQEISDGKIEGDTISFSMPSLYGGSVLTVKGKLEGEEINLQIESQGGNPVAKARLKKQ
jgi:hypothetical protein